VTFNRHLRAQAKQSKLAAAQRAGLLRRFASRNDGGQVYREFFATTAKAPADSVERLMGTKAEARFRLLISDKAEFASEEPAGRVNAGRDQPWG